MINTIPFSDIDKDIRQQLVCQENVFLAVNEGNLVAHIKVGLEIEDVEYAFYLKKDGKRIETRWYTRDSHVIFDSSVTPGRYTALGFIKLRDGFVRMLSSAPLVYGLPLAGSHISTLEVRRGRLSDLTRIITLNGRSRYDISVPGFRYEYSCLLIRKPGDCLFVILGGAVPDRSKVVLPRFSRFTWAEDFPGSVLCVADPTLELGTQIRLGWYFGTQDDDACDGLVKVIEAFACALGYSRNQIVTYGSSGGGYAAMQAAARIGDGATAIAINAQTNILAYGIESSVDEFLNVCTPGLDRSAASACLVERLTLAAAWRTPSGARSRCLLVQNSRDYHHLRKHLLPFAKEFNLPIPGTSSDGRMSVFLYDCPNGHGAEPRSMLPAIIEKMRMLREPH